MKSPISLAIVFAGLAMLFPAPFNLIRYGAGYPGEQTYAQIWLCGWLVVAFGLMINKIVQPLRK